MIEKLYNKYFQKSQSFLFPILGIKKNSEFNPEGTYLCLPGKVEPEDMILVVVYEKNNSEGFKWFESKMIMNNPLYKEKLETRNRWIYLFDYTLHQHDWFSFIMGKYSKLSSNTKRAIKMYYGEHTKAYEYIESYLYPQKHFERYSELLNVDVSILKRIGELCDGFDLDKETIAIPVEDFVILDKLP